MEENRSKFWMGLGLGSIIGVIAYRFSCSSKGKELKEKASRYLHQIGSKSEDVINSAKEKVMNAGTKAADKYPTTLSRSLKKQMKSKIKCTILPITQKNNSCF